MINPFHVHDYDMKFGEDFGPLKYRMMCRCGAECDHFIDAVTSTWISRIRCGAALALTSGLLAGAGVAAVIWWTS